MIVEKLPDIAKNISEQLSQTDKMVIIDNGGSGGAAKVTQNITKMMAEVPEVVQSLTGINLVDLISSIQKSNNNQGLIEESEIKEELVLD